MYDIVFIPYRGLDNVSPIILLERVACLEPPRPSELPWLLSEENCIPREPGTILVAWTQDRAKIARGYWYVPSENIRIHPPSPLPFSTPSPSLVKEIEEKAVGERGQEESYSGIVAAVNFILDIRDAIKLRRIRSQIRKELRKGK